MIICNSVPGPPRFVNEASHQAPLVGLKCDRSSCNKEDQRRRLLLPSYQDDDACIPEQVANRGSSPVQDDGSTSPPANSDQTSSTVTWYSRNDTAKDDPRELRKIIIPESRLGLSYVHALEATAKSSQLRKGNDITGKRRERKSVLPSQTWKHIESQLHENGIQLESREGGEAAEGRIKATLTYYGSSACFYNHQVKTKIRMRIRYYLSYSRDENGAIVNVRREGDTKDKGYLELKVKSPRAYDENSVDKYRVLVSDETIAELVNIDPKEPNFVNSLDEVRDAIQEDSAANKSLMIDTMFLVIKKMAMRKASFIRPSIVITYERSAYKYLERDYLIPSTPTKTKSPLKARSSKGREMKLSRLAYALNWRKRRGHDNALDKLDKRSCSDTGSATTDGRETEPQALPKDGFTSLAKDCHEADSSGKPAFELHDIEYQFTIDRLVRAHYPLLPVKGVGRMPIAEHFDISNMTELMRYPSEARVVEFKEPLLVATLPRKDRSPTHNTLNKVLVERMRTEILFGDYDENVGKYGNFRRRLMEEHHTNRIKNALIEIDFSGKAEYVGK